MSLAKYLVSRGHLSEFSDYLESVVVFNEPLVLLGDFNIYVDVPTDMDAIQFRDLLDSIR